MKVAAAAGGGLMLGFHWSNTSASSMKVITRESLDAATVTFNSYLSISPEGIITIMSPNPELGQNIKTSFPLIVAEELDADWSKVKVLQAPLDPSKFERQVTGGSGAVQPASIAADRADQAEADRRDGPLRRADAAGDRRLDRQPSRPPAPLCRGPAHRDLSPGVPAQDPRGQGEGLGRPRLREDDDDWALGFAPC